MRRLRARRARSQAAAIHLRLLAKSIVGHPRKPGVRREASAKPRRGDSKRLQTKIFRPCRGSLTEISYPGPCAPGYYLSTPPGLGRHILQPSFATDTS